MKAKCEVGMGVVTLHYQGTISFMGIGPSVTMKAHSGYVNLEMDVLQDTKGAVHVREYRIK